MRMTSLQPGAVLVAALTVVAGACGSDQGAADTSVPAVTTAVVAPTGGATTTSPDTTSAGSTAATGASETTATTIATEGSATMGTGSIDPGLGPYIDIAVADLVQRIGVTADQIEVSSATLKTWPDSSIGCPQKGMQYTQVLTDGALIVLTVDGKPYKYHAGGSRQPFYCPTSTATAGG